MTRPYRVGMQRPQQRYIAPDEIYDDVRHNALVEMPRQFPFTWNPVNGLGGADDIANQWRRGEGREDPRREEHMAAGLGRGVGNTGGGSYAAHRGMGSVSNDFLNLIKDVGSGIVSDTKKTVTDRASSGVSDFLKSGPGGELLNAVEAKAAEGVTKVVKKQAPNLMLLAVAGGAVGGAISSKLGKAGTILALVVAAYATNEILKAGQLEKK